MDAESLTLTRSQVWAAFIATPIVLLAFVMIAYFAGMSDQALKATLAKKLSCDAMEARNAR